MDLEKPNFEIENNPKISPNPVLPLQIYEAINLLFSSYPKITKTLEQALSDLNAEEILYLKENSLEDLEEESEEEWLGKTVWEVDAENKKATAENEKYWKIAWNRRSHIAV